MGGYERVIGVWWQSLVQQVSQVVVKFRDNSAGQCIRSERQHSADHPPGHYEQSLFTFPQTPLVSLGPAF